MKTSPPHPVNSVLIHTRAQSGRSRDMRLATPTVNNRHGSHGAVTQLQTFSHSLDQFGDSKSQGRTGV